MKFTQFAVFIAMATVGFAADEPAPVAISDTPPAVQKTINTRIGDGKLGGIDRLNESGDISFDVDYTTKDGDERGFTVAGDGQLLSTSVGLAETPAVVQKTIQAQAASWSVEGIDKNLADSEISYDVAITKDGKEKSFTVAEDGTVLTAEVALAEAPAAVQKAIGTQAPGWEVESIDENLDEATPTFEVDVIKDGKEKDFTFASDGALLSMEVTLDDAPAPAQATIKKQLADGTIKSIDENFDPAGNTFDVEAVAKDGSPNCFTVGAGGWLRSVEVTLDQVHPAARDTIKNQIGDGTILRIDKSLVEKKDKVLPYRVEGRKDGKPFNFSVGPKGKFLGIDPP